MVKSAGRSGKKESKCAAASRSAVVRRRDGRLSDEMGAAAGWTRTFAHEACFDVPGHLLAVRGEKLVCVPADEYACLTRVCQTVGCILVTSVYTRSESMSSPVYAHTVSDLTDESLQKESTLILPSMSKITYSILGLCVVSTISIAFCRAFST